MPDDALVAVTPLGAELRAMAPAIVSRQAGHRFLGYLDAQRRSLLSRDGKGRDVTRAELVEAYGFDTKFCAHMVRLGMQGVELLESGRVTLPVPEPARTWLRELRAGQHSMDEALEAAAVCERQIKVLLETSHLPEHPDYAAADEWLIEAYQRSWAERGIVSRSGMEQFGSSSGS